MSVIVDEAALREPNLLVPGKKPVGNVRIDWSHPLTTGLKNYFWIDGKDTIVDLVNGVPSWTKVGTLLHTPTIYGMSLNSQNAAGRIHTQSNIPNMDDSTYSLFAIFIPDYVATSLSLVYASSYDAETRIQIGASATGYIEYSTRGTINPYITVSDVNTYTLGQKYSVMGISNGRSDHKLYVDNGATAVDSSPVTRSTTSGADTVCLNGLERSGTDFSGSGRLIHACMYTKALNAEERQSLMSDPYQFLIPA